MMNIITLLWLLLIASSAQADVYKCQQPAKQIVYQAIPCSADTANQNIVKIEKLNAQQLEAAENKLKETEAERQALDKADAIEAQQQAIQRERVARQEAIITAAARREAVRQAATMNYRYRRNYGYRRNYVHNYTQRIVHNPNVVRVSSLPRSIGGR